MKESIGSTAVLNIMITFIVIVFAILSASLSYYKAYKVNNNLVNSIEKYEGYNSISKKEINIKLNGIGYQRVSINCNSKKNGMDLINGDTFKSDGYCMYKSNETGCYERYGVVTYITFNVPVVNNLLKIPVFSKSNRIYTRYGLECKE